MKIIIFLIVLTSYWMITGNGIEHKKCPQIVSKLWTLQDGTDEYYKYSQMFDKYKCSYERFASHP